MLPGPFRDRERANSPFWGRNFIDDLFRELGAGFFGNGIGGFGGTDIYEKNGNLYYELELPGMKKEDVSIQVSGDRLIVTGELSREEEEKGLNYLSRGRRYGQFSRALPLPEEMKDPNALKANFENGLLRIEIPLSESMGGGDTFDVEID